jgi:hypothetical protein
MAKCVVKRQVKSRVKLLSARLIDKFIIAVNTINTVILSSFFFCEKSILVNNYAHNIFSNIVVFA